MPTFGRRTYTRKTIVRSQVKLIDTLFEFNQTGRKEIRWQISS